MPEDMRNVCDALRDAFGAKLLYMKTPTLDVGSASAKALCEQHAAEQKAVA